MKSKLSQIENVIHFSLWILACFYSLYKLLCAQTGNVYFLLIIVVN